jgi:hypothetical protein
MRDDSSSASVDSRESDADRDGIMTRGESSDRRGDPGNERSYFEQKPTGR